MAPAERLRERGYLDLAREVAGRHCVALDAMLSRKRTRAESAARQEFWWRLYHHPERQLSYPNIGELVGRDHTTVMAGVAAHAATMSPDELQANAVEGAVQRTAAARAHAIRVLAADLRRIEEALPLLGLASLEELRAADGAGALICGGENDSNSSVPGCNNAKAKEIDNE